jgi:CubicO group peptidase (beta-lactamase class C family)
MKRPPLLTRTTLLFCCALSVFLIGCQSRRLAVSEASFTQSAPTASPAGSMALPPARPQPDYWPTRGWRTASPAEQGMDAARLEQMLDAVKAQGLNLHSLLVIRNGYIVSENYFGDTRPDTRREIYSCTKSFIATLVGMAVDRDAISGIAQPVAGFFPGRAFVVPDLNLIVVTTAATGGHDAIFDLIEQYIVPAAQRPPG